MKQKKTMRFTEGKTMMNGNYKYLQTDNKRILIQRFEATLVEELKTNTREVVDSPPTQTEAENT